MEQTGAAAVPQDSIAPLSGEAAAVTVEGGVEAPAADTEVSERAALQQQLEATRRAEELNRRHLEEQFKARLASELKVDAPQPERPKLTERDHAFLGARPGIERNPEFMRVAGSLPGYGTDKFYRALEALFPIEDFRSKDQLPSTHNAAEPAPEPEPKPQQARPERQGPVYSAPVHRDGAVNYSGKPAPLSPSSVRLSPDERQIARACGQSEVEYARHKLELQRRRAAGLLQEG